METILDIANFFNGRSEIYDETHPTMISGGLATKDITASLLPDNTACVLDLGCGTGLELEAIFMRFPDLKVTGIDVAEGMLSKLKEKYSEYNVDCIVADYLTYPLDRIEFDSVISVMSLHHFTKEQKLTLYKKIYNALPIGGVFAECDYIVKTVSEQAVARRKYTLLTKNLPANVLYHIDTPLFKGNELKILQKAGFSKIETVYEEGNTVAIKATK